MREKTNTPPASFRRGARKFRKGPPEIGIRLSYLTARTGVALQLQATVLFGIAAHGSAPISLFASAFGGRRTRKSARRKRSIRPSLKYYTFSTLPHPSGGSCPISFIILIVINNFYRSGRSSVRERSKYICSIRFLPSPPGGNVSPIISYA